MILVGLGIGIMLKNVRKVNDRYGGSPSRY